MISIIGLKEQMFRDAFQREKVPSGINWIEETLVGTDGFGMRIAYRITCANDYYGPRCHKFCQPMSSTVGHFQCTSNGSLACSPGWEGQSCDTGSFHINSYRLLNLVIFETIVQ